MVLGSLTQTPAHTEVSASALLSFTMLYLPHKDIFFHNNNTS